MHEYGVRREVETVAGLRGSSSVCMRRSESRVSGFSSYLIGGALCARSSGGVVRCVLFVCVGTIGVSCVCVFFFFFSI